MWVREEEKEWEWDEGVNDEYTQQAFKKAQRRKIPPVWNSLKLMFLISITSAFHHFGWKRRKIYYAETASKSERMWRAKIKQLTSSHDSSTHSMLMFFFLLHISHHSWKMSKWIFSIAWDDEGRRIIVICVCLALIWLTAT